MRCKTLPRHWKILRNVPFLGHLACLILWRPRLFGLINHLYWSRENLVTAIDNWSCLWFTVHLIGCTSCDNLHMSESKMLRRKSGLAKQIHMYYQLSIPPISYQRRRDALISAYLPPSIPAASFAYNYYLRSTTNEDMTTSWSYVLYLPHYDWG